MALAQFLAGWAGGPRDWLEQNPDRCMMSVHKPYTITKEGTTQWATAHNVSIPMSRQNLPIWPRLSQTIEVDHPCLLLRLVQSRHELDPLASTWTGQEATILDLI